MDTLPKRAAFAGLDILDKILATGGYFKRFCSDGIEKRKRDTRPVVRQ
jgi:hypothetical protein